MPCSDVVPTLQSGRARVARQLPGPARHLSDDQVFVAPEGLRADLQGGGGEAQPGPCWLLPCCCPINRPRPRPLLPTQRHRARAVHRLPGWVRGGQQQEAHKAFNCPCAAHVQGHDPCHRECFTNVPHCHHPDHPEQLTIRAGRRWTPPPCLMPRHSRVRPTPRPACAATCSRRPRDATTWWVMSGAAGQHVENIRPASWGWEEAAAAPWLLRCLAAAEGTLIHDPTHRAWGWRVRCRHAQTPGFQMIHCPGAVAGLRPRGREHLLR